MTNRKLPKPTSDLAKVFVSSLRKVDPLNKKLLLFLALLLILTDLGYEGQRSPDRLVTLLPISLASVALFFAIYLPFVLLLKKVKNSATRGGLQFLVVIIAEVIKSAFLIFLFRPEVFLAHFLERLPGDITLAALYWLVAGVAHAASEDHLFALSELKKAGETLAQQRSVSLRTAGEVEQQLHDKANLALLSDLTRLSQLSKQVMDSAKASEVKLEIQRLIRNQVRPLSRELKSRVEVIEAMKPLTTPVTLSRQIRVSLNLDATFIASYVIAMPNIFLTILTKSDWMTSILIFGISLSYPLLGRTIQALSTARKLSVFKGIFFVCLISVVSYLPLGWALAGASEQHPGLALTSITAAGILLLTCSIGTGWFALQRERAEIVEEIKRLTQEAKQELDLLDQSIWVAQRRWSYLIHGTVQAALTVAASRLELAKRPDEKLREDVEADINRAKQILTSPPEFTQSSKVLLDEIVQTWDGVCKFEFQIAPSAELALDQHATSVTCFIEIVKELVSNASRHGGATKFWLNAYLNSNGEMEIITGNNGRPIPNDISPGLGFQMISELTKEWRIDRKTSGFSAILPIPKKSMGVIR